MTSQNPLSVALEMQRASLEQFQRTLAATVEAQQRSARSLARVVTLQTTLTEEGMSVTRKITHLSVRGVAMWLPNDLDGLRTAVDEGFDVADELQADSLALVDETVSDGAPVYDRAGDRYVERMNTSFDTFLDAYEHVDTGATPVPIEAPDEGDATSDRTAPDQSRVAAAPEPTG